MKLFTPMNDLGLGGHRRRKQRLRFILILTVVITTVLFYFIIFSAKEKEKPHSMVEQATLTEPIEFKNPEEEPKNKNPSTSQSLKLVEEIDNPYLIKGKIQKNQTLFAVVRARGVQPMKLQPVIDSLKNLFNFRRSRPGDQYEVYLNDQGDILEFRYKVNPEEVYIVQWIGDTYMAQRESVPTETVLTSLGGIIEESLYTSLTEEGEGNSLVSAFNNIFAYDLDFGSISQPGDEYRIIFEKVYLKDEFLRYGKILAVEYKGGKGTYRAFYYEQQEGGKYYDDKGVPLWRKFLKTPVPGARVTSPFTYKRFHPILKRNRPHLGIDYGASTGTPIYAAADGVVTFAGWKGQNGNLIVLKHEGNYDTVYAHLSRIRRGIKKKAKVSQMDVIGYVGNTGLSTGPHLHYGMKYRGRYIDPGSLNVKRASALKGNQLANFKKEIAPLIEQLDKISTSQGSTNPKRTSQTAP